MNRNLLISAALTAAILAFSSSAQAATPGDLYVGTTNGGTLTPAAHGTYRLVLKHPAANVTAFTDRPARQASTETLKRFVDQWPQEGFKADPPNAALVVDGAPAGHDVMIVELSDPKLAKTGALTLTARPVKASGALKPFAKRADQRVARSFGKASLFVDAGAAQAVKVTIGINTPASSNASIQLDEAQYFELTDGPAMWQTPNPASLMLSSNGIIMNGTAQPLSGRFSGEISTGANAISGIATVPAGVTLTIQVNGGSPTTIANGHFSLPIN